MKHTHSFYGHSFAEERRVYQQGSPEPAPTAPTSSPGEGGNSDGQNEKYQVKEETQSSLAKLKKAIEQQNETTLIYSPGAKDRMISLGNYRMEDGKLVKGTKGNEAEYDEYSFDPHPESITFIPITVDGHDILQVEYTFPGRPINFNDGNGVVKINKYITFFNENGNITGSSHYQTDKMTNDEKEENLKQFIQKKVIPALS